MSRNSSKSVVWNQAITSTSSEEPAKETNRTMTVSGQIFGWARRSASIPQTTSRI
jgi:hypothetical protein